jgi:hypothetical protein
MTASKNVPKSGSKNVPKSGIRNLFTRDNVVFLLMIVTVLVNLTSLILLLSDSKGKTAVKDIEKNMKKLPDDDMKMRLIFVTLGPILLFSLTAMLLFNDLILGSKGITVVLSALLLVIVLLVYLSNYRPTVIMEQTTYFTLNMLSEEVQNIQMVNILLSVIYASVQFLCLLR